MGRSVGRSQSAVLEDGMKQCRWGMIHLGVKTRKRRKKKNNKAGEKKVIALDIIGFKFVQKKNITIYIPEKRSFIYEIKMAYSYLFLGCSCILSLTVRQAKFSSLSISLLFLFIDNK